MSSIYDLRAASYQDKVLINTPIEERYAPGLDAIDPSWFNTVPEGADDLPVGKLFVYDGAMNGRAFGIVAPFDECWMNDSKECITVNEKIDTTKIYQGMHRATDGKLYPVSLLAGTLGHYQGDRMNEAVLFNQGFMDEQGQMLNASHDVMKHQLLYGQYHPTNRGLAFCGAVMPHVSKEQVRQINASAVSITMGDDARTHKQVLLGAVFVNNPAYRNTLRSNPLQMRHAAIVYDLDSSRERIEMNTTLTPSSPEVTDADSHECTCKTRNASVDGDLINAAAAPGGDVPGGGAPAPAKEDKPAGGDIEKRVADLEDAVKGIVSTLGDITDALGI